MAQNIQTIVKLFAIFFAFQICLLIFIEAMPTSDPFFNYEKQQYLDYLDNTTTITNFLAVAQNVQEGSKSFIEDRGLFNSAVINAFLGVLNVITNSIGFILDLATAILFTPSIILNILFYNFIGVSGEYISYAYIIINMLFYVSLYYITFKRRISQN